MVPRPNEVKGPAEMTEQNTVGTEIGNKLSVKTFDWSKGSIQEAVFADKKNDVFLMRVMGVATNVKSYKSKQKGDDGKELEGYGIVGDFEAQGPDGEVIPGSTLYLPGYITDQIAASLMAEDDAVVKLAMDIYARYDEKSATSYVFVGRSLIKRENSMLEALREETKALALPAPPTKAKK